MEGQAPAPSGPIHTASPTTVHHQQQPPPQYQLGPAPMNWYAAHGYFPSMPQTHSSSLADGGNVARQPPPPHMMPYYPPYTPMSTSNHYGDSSMAKEAFELLKGKLAETEEKCKLAGVDTTYKINTTNSSSYLRSKYADLEFAYNRHGQKRQARSPSQGKEENRNENRPPKPQRAGNVEVKDEPEVNPHDLDTSPRMQPTPPPASPSRKIPTLVPTVLDPVNGWKSIITKEQVEMLLTRAQNQTDDGALANQVLYNVLANGKLPGLNLEDMKPSADISPPRICLLVALPSFIIDTTSKRQRPICLWFRMRTMIIAGSVRAKILSDYSSPRGASAPASLKYLYRAEFAALTLSPVGRRKGPPGSFNAVPGKESFDEVDLALHLHKQDVAPEEIEDSLPFGIAFVDGHRNEVVKGCDKPGLTSKRWSEIVDLCDLWSSP